MQELLKPTTAAKLLDMHPNTVKRYMQKGWLDGIKLKSGHWRIRAESVRRLIQGDGKVDRILKGIV